MYWHTEKVQKYEQGKIGLHFWTCGTDNVVEQGTANSANQPTSAKKGGMATPC